MGTRGGGTDEANLQLALLSCWNTVRLFYDEWKEQHPDKPLTELTDLTRKMVGKVNEPTLKLKAMETFGILRFLINEVPKHSRKIGEEVADTITQAGSCLVKFMDRLRECGPIVPTMVIQDPFHSPSEMLRFFQFIFRFGRRGR